MNEFDWKQAEPLLMKLSKSQNISWEWKRFSADERCALHELITKGLVQFYSRIGEGTFVQISEAGLREVFIKVL